MKKVILASLFLVSTAFAADAVAPVFRTEVTSVQVSKSTTVNVATVCLSGFVFAVALQDKSTTNNGSGGVAMVQVMQPARRGDPVQPIPCK